MLSAQCSTKAASCTNVLLINRKRSSLSVPFSTNIATTGYTIACYVVKWNVCSSDGSEQL